MDENSDNFASSSPETPRARCFLTPLCVISLLALGAFLGLPEMRGEPSQASEPLSQAPEAENANTNSIDPRLQELLRDTGATVRENEKVEDEYCEPEGYVWHPEDAKQQVGGSYSRYGGSHNAEASYANVGSTGVAGPSAGSAVRRKRKPKVQAQSRTRGRKKRG